MQKEKLFFLPVSRRAVASLLSGGVSCKDEQWMNFKKFKALAWLSYGTLSRIGQEQRQKPGWLNIERPWSSALSECEPSVEGM